MNKALIDPKANIADRVSIMRSLIEESRDADPDVFAMRLIASVDRLSLTERPGSWEVEERRKVYWTSSLIAVVLLVAVAVTTAWFTSAPALGDEYQRGWNDSSALSEASCKATVQNAVSRCEISSEKNMNELVLANRKTSEALEAAEKTSKECVADRARVADAVKVITDVCKKESP